MRPRRKPRANVAPAVRQLAEPSPTPTPSWLAPVVGTVVALAAAALYASTAARDIVVGDTSELITAAITLGVVHAPGYPLFTVLGHLFSAVPVGPLPFRVNLMSAVFDAAAVLVPGGGRLGFL